MMCPECSGKGEIVLRGDHPDDKVRCQRCDGRRRIHEYALVIWFDSAEDAAYFLDQHSEMAPRARLVKDSEMKLEPR